MDTKQVQPESGQKLPAPQPPKNVLPIPVSLTDAITWTDNWRHSAHRLKANSFLFPIDDFQALLKEPGVEGIRMYMGLRINEHNEIMEKMLCVGVDGNGNDIIPLLHRGQSNDDPEDGDTGIYDFSHPCPPLCRDSSSVLTGSLDAKLSFRLAKPS